MLYHDCSNWQFNVSQRVEKQRFLAICAKGVRMSQGSTLLQVLGSVGSAGSEGWVLKLKFPLCSTNWVWKSGSYFCVMSLSKLLLFQQQYVRCPKPMPGDVPTKIFQESPVTVHWGRVLAGWARTWPHCRMPCRMHPCRALTVPLSLPAVFLESTNRLRSPTCSLSKT